LAETEGRGIGFAVILGIAGTFGLSGTFFDSDGLDLGLGLIRSIAFVPPMKAGFEKYLIGFSSSAFLAKVFQIRAGKEPPVTEFSPPIPLNSSVASSLNRATEADSCGV
jgi:hypothetical protein